MKKNGGSPWRWLLLIPAQIVLGTLFVLLGTRLDLGLFSNPEAQGHGMPVFSALFLLIAAAVTLAVIILSLVLTVRGLRRRKRSEET